MSGLIADWLRGLLAESGLQQRTSTAARFAAMAMVLMAFLVCMIAIGLVALAAAVFLSLHSPLSPAAAAGLTAAGFLIVVAIVSGLVWWRWRRQIDAQSAAAARIQPAEAVADMQALLEAGLAGTTASIQRQPITSVLLAAAIGVAAERLVPRDRT